MGPPSNPVHAAPSPFPAPSSGEGPRATPSTRLLFIDNDPEIRAMAFEALGREFPAVAFSGVNGRESFEHALAAGAFDLVVADYTLDWAEGQDVIAQLKRSYPDCPVIAFTVTGEDRTTLRALRRGDSDDPEGRWPALLSLLSTAIGTGIEETKLAWGRRRTMEALRAAESRFRSVFETATDAIVLADSKGCILGWNGAATRVFGYAEREVLGRPLTLLMPERYREREEGGLRRFRESGTSTMIGRTVEVQGLRKDGTEFPLELSVGAWESEEGGGFSGVMRDLTDRKRADDALRRSYEQQRTLTARVARIQEEERIAIAREIHDELGQSLTALRLHVAWLLKRVTPGHEHSEGKRDKLAQMARIVESLVVQVRRISAELRPGKLDELGLTAAIESQAEEFSTRTGIPCNVHSDLEERGLGPDVTKEVFRVFQECLTNVARHARAQSVEVGLSQQEGSLVLKVRDDGQGIGASALGNPRSLGLLGMIERCRSIGGDIRITGAAGEGTTVTVTAPLGRRRVEEPTT